MTDTREAIHVSSEDGTLDAFVISGSDKTVFTISVREHWIRAERVNIDLNANQARELAASLLEFADSEDKGLLHLTSNQANKDKQP